MAKVKTWPGISAIRGAIGDLVFTQEEGETQVRRKGERTKPLSPRQRNQLGRLGLASRRTKLFLMDPAMKASYQPACRGHLTAHDVAVKDLMHPPAITGFGFESYTGKAGDVIHITAQDDFRVVRVIVQVATVQGEILEEGTAVLVSDLRADRRDSTPKSDDEVQVSRWSYISQSRMEPQTTILIKATAWDLPGNCAGAEAFFYIRGAN
jgi:hypothetical protein